MASFDPKNMPMHVGVPAFNRTEDGRVKFTIEVYFEGQSHWKLEKTYSELRDLHRQIAVSQYSEQAKAFPPKHPIGLALKMKFQGRQSAMKSEVDFLKERRTAMETFLNDLLCAAGPDGVDEVIFLNQFFNAFEERHNGVKGHAELDRSMLHMLKSCRIPKSVYRQLWADGYTLDTLRTIEREKWANFGVTSGCIEQLERKLGGLRHNTSQTVIGPDGRVTSVVQDSTGRLVGAFAQGAVGMGRVVSSGSMQPMTVQSGMQPMMQPMMQQPMLVQQPMQQPMMVQQPMQQPGMVGQLYPQSYSAAPAYS